MNSRVQTAGSMPGTSGVASQNQVFFNEMQGFLRNMMGELQHVREISDRNEKHQQQRCDQIRKEIEQERFDGRELTNKFRYEFDELVHKRVETVLDALEDMEQSHQFKDRQQQHQLDALQGELRALKENLCNVSSTWTRLKRNDAMRGRVSGSATAAPIIATAVANPSPRAARPPGSRGGTSGGRIPGTTEPQGCSGSFGDVESKTGGVASVGGGLRASPLSSGLYPPGRSPTRPMS
eukprot:TRINITY_DN33813_c0_g1_i1.p1 TRINITY_DN33813_c0_g1~~TRINITY_DN33813_c0_g1_i1.p1  ORF type:complete len:237 (-),score=52.41 TRINITY_DN33813_c0_g1_i1:235-945(-)